MKKLVLITLAIIITLSSSTILVTQSYTPAYADCTEFESCFDDDTTELTPEEVWCLYDRISRFTGYKYSDEIARYEVWKRYLREPNLVEKLQGAIESTKERLNDCSEYTQGEINNILDVDDIISKLDNVDLVLNFFNSDMTPTQKVDLFADLFNTVFSKWGGLVGAGLQYYFQPLFDTAKAFIEVVEQPLTRFNVESLCAASYLEAEPANYPRGAFSGDWHCWEEGLTEKYCSSRVHYDWGELFIPIVGPWIFAQQVDNVVLKTCEMEDHGFYGDWVTEEEELCLHNGETVECVESGKNAYCNWSDGQGPANDGADDNYDVSTLQTTSTNSLCTNCEYTECEDCVEVIPDVAVLYRGFPSHTGDLLSECGIPHAFIDVEYASYNLSPYYYPVLIIPTGGLHGLDSLPSFKRSLESYVNDGGTVIVFSQQQGYEYTALPGGNLSGYGWQQDMSCQHRSVGISTYHPMLSGASSSVLDLKVDGYFTSYPQDSTVLLIRTKNSLPAMVMYDYGEGEVIATTAYTDYACGRGDASQDGIRLFKDMLALVTAGDEEIPEYTSSDTINIPISFTNTDLSLPVEGYQEFDLGETIDIPIAIENSANQSVDKVVFHVLNPDFQPFISDEGREDLEIQAVLSGGETTSVDFTYQTTSSSEIGLYSIWYSLYSGETLLDSGVGDHFLLGISNSGMNTYTVNSTFISPNWNLIQQDSTSVTLLPQETWTANMSYPNPSEFGVWRFVTAITDYAGELVDVQENTFVVSQYAENPDGWVYSGSEISFSINSEKENYYIGEEASFVVTIWNNGDVDREVTCWYSFPHNYWAKHLDIYGSPGTTSPGHKSNLYQTIEVPAHSYNSFTYSIPVYSYDRFWAEFYEGDSTSYDYLGRSSRAFWANSKPYITTSVSTHNQEYDQGDDVPIDLTLRNARGTESTLTADTKILNPYNLKIFEDSFDITLAGYTSYGQSIIAPLPFPLAEGAYSVVVDVYEGDTKVSSGSTYFLVPQVLVDIDISADKQNYALGENMSLCLSLDNSEDRDFSLNVSFKLSNNDTGNILIEDTFDTVLPAGSHYEKIYIIPLPWTTATGTYMAYAEACTEQIMVGSGFAALSITKPSMEVNFSTEKDIYVLDEGSVPLLVSIMNNNNATYNVSANISVLDPLDTEVFASSFDVTLSGNESDERTVSYPIPSDADYGDYTSIISTYINGNESGSDTTVFEVSRGYTINVNFDHTDGKYKARDAIGVELEVTNTAPVSRTLEVNIAAPEIGLSDTAIFDLASGQTGTINYNLSVPADIAAGQYSVTTTALIDNYTKEFSFTIPESRLTLETNQEEYSIGDTVSVTVSNVGGEDATGEFFIQLSNKPSLGLPQVVVYQSSRNESIWAGESITLEFTIPDQTVTGYYGLHVDCRNLTTGRLTSITKDIYISGLGASLTLSTDKNAYFADETIAMTTDINNQAVEITDGMLNLQIFSVASLNTTTLTGNISGDAGLLWNSSVFEGGAMALPAGDLDGDGYDDVFVMCSLAPPDEGSATPELRALRGRDGSLLWARQLTELGGWVEWAGDMDGDGMDDVLISYVTEDIDTGSYIYNLAAVRGYDGFELWLESEYGNVGLADPAGDLDGDGCNDILTAVQNASISDSITEYRLKALSGCNGSKLWNCTANITYPYMEDNSQAGMLSMLDLIPAEPAGDLDGDGLQDIFISSTTISGSQLTAMTREFTAVRGYDGQELWQEMLSGIPNALPLGDLNDDGLGDILATVITVNENTSVWETTLTALNGSDGREIWHTSLDDMAVVLSRRAIGDINGDDKQDVLLLLGNYPEFLYSHSIGVFSGADGQQLWQLDLGGIGYGKRAGDMDGDGLDEVLITSYAGPDDQGNITLEVYPVSASGQQLWRRSVPVTQDEASYIAGMLMMSMAGQDSMVQQMLELAQMQSNSATSAGDLNGDGLNDVLLRTVNTSDSDETVYSLAALEGDTGQQAWSVQSTDTLYHIPLSIAKPYLGDEIEQPDFNRDGVGDIVLSTMYEGEEISSIIYTLTSPEARSLVWEQDIPIASIPSYDSETANVNIDIPTELPYAEGKLYAVANLYSNTSQIIDRSDNRFFFIGDRNTLLTLETDKQIYKPGETIEISGEVMNNVTGTTGDFHISVKQDDVEIYSETVSLEPGGSYGFTTTTTAQTSFVLEGTVEGVTVVDRVRVETPTIEATVVAPDVVDFNAFDIDVLLENTGDIDVQITVTIGDESWNLAIPAGGSDLIETTLSISGDTDLEVVITGDVEQIIPIHIIMGEQARIDILESTFIFDGPVEIPVEVTNIGILDTEFQAVYVIEDQTITRTYSLSAGETIADTLDFDLTQGRHTLTYTTPFESGSETILVSTPSLYISQLPTNLNLVMGQETSWTFLIKNDGVAEGEAYLHLMLPDYEEYEFNWVRPGEEVGITFNFTVPDDLESNEYKARYELNGEPGEFTYTIEGAEISVDAGLDKHLYSEGETATVTLNISNLCSFDLSLYGIVQLDEFEDSGDVFTLPAGSSQTLQFEVPVTFTGHKLFYGIYMESGRSLYLNGLYIHQQQGVTLYTDKQVYEMGDTATVNIEPDSSGTLSVSALDYSNVIQLTAGESSSFTFDIPELKSGTYYVDYTFNGESYQYPFDVIGYSAKVTEFNLDKYSYVSGDTIYMSADVEANRGFDGFLRVYIHDYAQRVDLDEFDVPASFVEGENNIDTSRIITAETKGIHMVYYTVYATIGGEDIPMASGAEFFDAMPTPNQPPVAIMDGPYTVDEGSAVSFNALNSSDPDGDMLEYRWDYDNDGVWDTAWSVFPMSYHTWDDDYSDTVVLEVRDIEFSDTVTTEVTVNNLAPFVLADGDWNADIGEAINLSVAFYDSGTLDTHSAVIDWGDGATEPAAVEESDGIGSFSASHVYANTGDYTVTVTVTDDDGGVGTDTWIVTVGDASNDDPVSVHGGPYTGNEGSAITFDGSGSYDPDGSIVSYEWDLDCDGNFSDAQGAVVQNTWDDDYTCNVSLKVTDDEGATAIATTTVTVNNVAPTVEAGPDQSTECCVTNVPFNGSFTDPGTPDTHTINWDFGDGGTASDTLSPTHTYGNPGVYNVTLTVTDDDGGVGSDTMTVNVTETISLQLSAWGRTWSFLEWYACGHPTDPTDFFGSHSYPLVTANDSIYSWIEADDSSYWRHTDYKLLPLPSEHSQLFVYKINQDRATVSNLSITWTGHGGNGDLIYHTKLKIWNYQTGSWHTLVDVTSPGSKIFQTYDRGITTNAMDFIEAGSGNVSILVSADDDGRGLTEDTEGVFTDHISLNVNATDTPSSPSTTTYTFATGGGSDKWCWEGHVHLIDWGFGHPNSPADFANSYGYTAGGSSEYSSLSASDDSRWLSSISHNLGCCAGDRNCELFKFNIAESPSAISNICLKWEGHGTTLGTIYYTTLKIWNPSSGTWEQLHNQQNTTSDVTWIDNIASDCLNYIDEEGNLYVLACSQRSGLPSKCGIWTDYIEVTITNE